VFAVIAAILFGLALLLDLARANLGSTITVQTLTIAGLLFLALQWAIGARLSGRRPYWGRRPGRG
jgi:hypothetical protein